MSFNPANRTVFGIANTTGVYSVDVYYKDDAGYLAFSNFRLAILPRATSQFDIMNYLFPVTVSIFGGMLVFFTYLIQFNFSILPMKKSASQKKKEMAR